MKTFLSKRRLHSAFLILAGVLAFSFARSQSSLEFFSGASNPTGNGSSISSQVITFQKNNDNPGGNLIGAFSQTITTTFSFANQQYSLPTGHISTQTGLSFGTTLNQSNATASSNPIFPLMNNLSSPSNSHFTSLSLNTPGTGIDVAANRAVEIFASCRPLFNAGLSTSGRYYFGDLVLVFNKPVSNPVLHIVGLGGFFTSGGNTLGFTSELELSTSGVVLSKLSGSTELDVTSSKILNSATNPTATTGSGAASGSVLAAATSITSLTFKVYLRGNGGNSAWSVNSMHTGDAFMVGVSLVAPADIPLPVKLSSFTATLNNSKVDIKWTSATEENLSHYIVERSTDGINFSDAGIVFAYGNSNETRNYSLSDNITNLQSSILYYRLRSVDIDGKNELSNIRVIRIAKGTEATVSILAYPNPAVNDLRVTIPASWQNKKAVYELFTLNGQVAKRIESGNSSQTETINIANLAPGYYIVKVSCNNEVAQQRIVKQ
jgi:hypothetical protein